MGAEPTGPGFFDYHASHKASRFLLNYPCQLQGGGVDRFRYAPFERALPLDRARVGAREHLRAEAAADASPFVGSTLWLVGRLRGDDARNREEDGTGAALRT